MNLKCNSFVVDGKRDELVDDSVEWFDEDINNVEDTTIFQILIFDSVV